LTTTAPSGGRGGLVLLASNLSSRQP
jgi:hypothetical protein